MSDAEDININRLITEIALIKKDIKNLERLIDNVDRLSREINELSKLIAIQHRIIETHENRIASLFDITKTDENSNTDQRSQLKERLEEMRRTTLSDRAVINQNIQKASDEIDEKFKTYMEKIETRIKALENWRWWVMGMGAVLVTILSYVWKNIFGA
jgi:seryl-tRNA synthetase